MHETTFEVRGLIKQGPAMTGALAYQGLPVAEILMDQDPTGVPRVRQVIWAGSRPDGARMSAPTEPKDRQRVLDALARVQAATTVASALVGGLHNLVINLVQATLRDRASRVQPASGPRRDSSPPTPSHWEFLMADTMPAAMSAFLAALQQEATARTGTTPSMRETAQMAIQIAMDARPDLTGAEATTEAAAPATTATTEAAEPTAEPATEPATKPAKATEAAKPAKAKAAKAPKATEAKPAKAGSITAGLQGCKPLCVKFADGAATPVKSWKDLMVVLLERLIGAGQPIPEKWLRPVDGEFVHTCSNGQGVYVNYTWQQFWQRYLTVVQTMGEKGVVLQYRNAAQEVLEIPVQ